MTRHAPEQATERPWAIKFKPDRPGGGYLLVGANGATLRVYSSRADVDLILESVNACEGLREENAALRAALEEITRGMNDANMSPRWAEVRAWRALEVMG